MEPNPLLKSKLLQSYWEGALRLTDEEAEELDLENNEYILIEDHKQKSHIFHYNDYTLYPIKKKETTI